MYVFEWIVIIWSMIILSVIVGGMATMGIKEYRSDHHKERRLF